MRVALQPYSEQAPQRHVQAASERRDISSRSSGQGQGAQPTEATTRTTGAADAAYPPVFGLLGQAGGSDSGQDPASDSDDAPAGTGKAPPPPALAMPQDSMAATDTPRPEP